MDLVLEPSNLIEVPSEHAFEMETFLMMRSIAEPYQSLMHAVLEIVVVQRETQTLSVSLVFN